MIKSSFDDDFAERYEYERVETFGAVDENDLVAFSVSVDKVTRKTLCTVKHKLLHPSNLQHFQRK